MSGRHFNQIKRYNISISNCRSQYQYQDYRECDDTRICRAETFIGSQPMIGLLGGKESNVRWLDGEINTPNREGTVDRDALIEFSFNWMQVFRHLESAAGTNHPPWVNA